MKTKRTNPDFLNGVPELLVLRLLSRRPMHGYDLVQSLKMVSGGVLEFGEGCIYPILHRLEAEHVLKSHEAVVAGRARRLYQVTAKGKKRLAQSSASWQQITSVISQILQGGTHDAADMA